MQGFLVYYYYYFYKTLYSYEIYFKKYNIESLKIWYHLISNHFKKKTRFKCKINLSSCPMQGFLVFIYLFILFYFIL